jgi:hypothetical protein
VRPCTTFLPFVGQTFPWKDYKKVIEAARNIIRGDDQHVAGLKLDRMWMDDATLEFIETQAMMSKKEEDDQSSFTRTWQIFVYCRNRSTPKPSSEKNKKVVRSDAPTSPRSATSHDGDTAIPQNDAPRHGLSVPYITSPIRNIPENIYRHRTDGNCPAQIAAYLIIDPESEIKAYW